jgi:hypothetical protein
MRSSTASRILATESTKNTKGYPEASFYVFYVFYGGHSLVVVRWGEVHRQLMGWALRGRIALPAIWHRPTGYLGSFSSMNA